VVQARELGDHDADQPEIDNIPDNQAQNAHDEISPILHAGEQRDLD
jgi:hypothetical protein